MRYVSALLVFFSSVIFSQQVTLRDTTNEFDYVIITVPEFKSVCEPFKQHKQNMFGFKVLIVDTGMIHNEFNSYSKKEDNIREFISYAGTYWQYPQPKYFLLAGDLSKIPNFLHILFAGTQLVDSAYSDHEFSYSVYDSSSNNCLFGIGRIPANNSTQLNSYFNKVIYYENDSSYFPWMSNNLFFSQYDTLTFSVYEQIAIELMTNIPNHLSNKFFTENINSTNYGNKDSLFNFINIHGVLTLWLIGGSNDTQFSRLPLFTIEDLDLIVNGYKNFFTFFLGRQRFGSDINNYSIANKLISDEDASIGVIASVGHAYAYEQAELFKTFSQLTLGSGNYAVGDALISAKNSFAYPSSINKIVLNIWGDPSLKLKYNPLAGSDDSQFEKPLGFTLYQNYPNPFNPSTRISFSLPTPGNVQIKIFDVLGNEVAVLSNEFYDSGFHSIDFNAQSVSKDLSSGIYFYSLKAGDFIQSKKMMFLK